MASHVRSQIVLLWWNVAEAQNIDCECHNRLLSQDTERQVYVYCGWVCLSHCVYCMYGDEKCGWYSEDPIRTSVWACSNVLRVLRTPYVSEVEQLYLYGWKTVNKKNLSTQQFLLQWV